MINEIQKTPYINLLLPGVITNSGEPKGLS